ncbi:ADP-ribosylglycohydrolase family protein [Micromonospora auratinigra]|uniref:ADP-ribosylglycohydrolase family protein n=1 Tax=Micromonospora auratinigra TaxID=261654 RepID=UPI001E3F326A|nr:ADP-ribosylglycohydrolase family protein [Micromonospora auratinigra]
MNADIRSATDALRGLALGDAFGETWFFRPAGEVRRALAERVPVEGPWRWTDDTAMALALHRVLRDRGEVAQDELARAFAEAYAADPYRNYGASMHDVLRAVGAGEPWATVTGRQFGGQGSWGNGAAMRVAPLGAYFSADLDLVAAQAVRSAQVTHAHPEAVAGAVAVAVAAALAVRGTSADELLPAVVARTPDSEVASRLRRVAGRPFTDEPGRIAGEVGCGALISAPDTVPYALWCAARHLDDLVEALWTTATAGGDMDTTCAIVGGVVAGRTGLSGVPAAWTDAVEPLPAWVGC